MEDNQNSWCAANTPCVKYYVHLPTLCPNLQTGGRVLDVAKICCPLVAAET